MKRQRIPLLVALCLLLATPAIGQLAPPLGHPQEMLLTLRGLDRTARVLLVTAHPDDEDSGLLVKLRHGEGVETALLSLTRGEGGQNEIGTELFHALGVLRSRELESAARYTGVRQFFSRAFEFGYSFSVEETNAFWGPEPVLRDIVRVIRLFQPDVVLTLPYGGAGGGQHHQASAQLAMDAFHLAGTTRWPELGPPHQAARLFAQIWRPEAPASLCEIEVGDYDPLLGNSPEAFGEDARQQHKCQGMARPVAPLARRLSRWEWVLSANADDPPRAVPDFFAGLDEPLLENSLGETPFGANLRQAANQVRVATRPGTPATVLPPLLELWDLLEAAGARTDLPASAPSRLATLRTRAAAVMAYATGFRLDARTEARLNAMGRPFSVEIAMENAGPEHLVVELQVDRVGPGPARRTAVQAPDLRLAPGEFHRLDLMVNVASTTPTTAAQPVPESPTPTPGEDVDAYLGPDWSAFRVVPWVTVAGRRVQFPECKVQVQEIRADFPERRWSDPQLVPEPSIRAEHARVAAPVGPGESLSAFVSFRVSSLEGGPVRIRLASEPGWVAVPNETTLVTMAGGAELSVAFQVQGPVGEIPADPVTVRAIASLPSGQVSEQGYRVVDYPHIRPGALLERAETQVVSFPCRKPQVRVGYITGTGDEMPEALRRLGLEPRFLEREDLLFGDLSELDVIVTGVRAYKVRDDLKSAQARLMAWAEEGGVLLVQYNKFEFNDGQEWSPFAPFPETKVGSRRVTVENSPVTVNVPDHPVFQEPNRLGEPDWQGWVQERGLYFLDITDPRYRDLITLEDPWPYNRGPKGGALVEAPVGNGRWVYVGVGLFRQLPAAVPGAYRLLSNLLGLGAHATADPIN